MSDVGQSVTVELEALSSSGERCGSSSERLESLSPAPLCTQQLNPHQPVLPYFPFLRWASPASVTESGLDALQLASQVLEFISINLTSQSPKVPNVLSISLFPFRLARV